MGEVHGPEPTQILAEHGIGIELLRRLSGRSRKRWPAGVLPASAGRPGLLPTV